MEHAMIKRRKYLFHKRKLHFIVLIFAMTTLLTVFCQIVSFAETEKELSLDKAVNLATVESPELKKTYVELILQGKKLKEARDAIKDIRKKESSPKFSLLFNIEFPEKHGLPKEIDLLMKIPTIQAASEELNRKIPELKRKVRLDTETAYLNLMTQIENLAFAQKNLENIEATIENYTRLVVDHGGDIRNVDTAQKNKAQFEKEYNNILLKIERLKSGLSNLVGIDVRSGYQFVKDYPMIVVGFHELEDIKKYTIEHDFNFYVIQKNRKVAERRVTELQGVYQSNFGSKFAAINSILKKDGAVDVANFSEKYEKMLESIEAPWIGAYSINLIFFTLKIPKEWFMGQFTGPRYFEDEKYMLLTAVIDRELARQEEIDQRAALSNAVTDAFLNLKELERSYLDQKDAVQTKRKIYLRAKAENIAGKMTFQQFDSIRNEMMSDEKSMQETLLEYIKSVSAFNYMTGGYLNSSANERNESIDTSGGQAFLEEDYGNQAYWFIRSPIEEMLFEFGVSIPESYAMTHYELYTAAGERIGGRMDITESIRHLPLVFNGSTKLILRLYQGDVLSNICELDAAETDGILDLSKLSPTPNAGDVIGEWTLSGADTDFVGELTIKLKDGVAADSFVIKTMDGKDVSASINIQSGLRIIRTMFIKTGGIEVHFYAGGNPVFSAEFAKESENGVLKFKRLENRP